MSPSTLAMRASGAAFSQTPYVPFDPKESGQDDSLNLQKRPSRGIPPREKASWNPKLCSPHRIVSDSVILCVSDPEVAVTVTVEVPVGTGFGFVALLDPLHPANCNKMIRSDSIPPLMNTDSMNFFRLRSRGISAAKPSGTHAPIPNGRLSTAPTCASGPRETSAEPQFKGRRIFIRINAIHSKHLRRGCDHPR